jgi:hypothetical protein
MTIIFITSIWLMTDLFTRFYGLFYLYIRIFICCYTEFF